MSQKKICDVETCENRIVDMGYDLVGSDILCPIHFSLLLVGHPNFTKTELRIAQEIKEKMENGTIKPEDWRSDYFDL